MKPEKIESEPIVSAEKTDGGNIVHCTPLGIPYLANLLSAVQHWRAAGINVQITYVEATEHGGTLAGAVDGMELFLEVKPR